MRESNLSDSVSKIRDEFDGDVRHVTGNMFLVRRDSIEFANQGISSEDGRLIYGNPRWYTNGDGNPEAKGINRGKLDELKNSIKDRGVDHPIRLRASERDGNSILEVVNGERRLRAIDELCNDDEDCWDASLQRKRSAVDLYEWVECRIEYMDDATALRCALQLNETGEVIGDVANINVVKTLRMAGYDESSILQATGKSISWLREMDQIIGLDDVCLKHYQDDMINKRVALKLALIRNVEERVQKLNQILHAATERHMEEVRKSRQKMEKAVEEAETEDFQDSIDQIGSDEESSKPSKKSSKAKIKAEKAKNELESVSSRKVTAKSKDEEKVSGVAKPLSHVKISSKLLKPLSELIENNGSHEDIEFRLDSLIMIQAVLQAIMSGDSDLMSILEKYCLDDSLQDASYVDEDDDAEDESDIGDEDESDIGDEDESDIGDEDESDIGDEDESDIGDEDESDIDAEDESDIGDEDESEIDAEDESDIDAEDEDSYIESEREFEKELDSLPRE